MKEAQRREIVDLIVDSALRLPQSQRLEIYDALKDNLFQTNQAPDEAQPPSIPGRRTSARDLFYRHFQIENRKSKIENRANWFPFWILTGSAAIVGLWQPYIWPAIVAITEWVRSW